MRIEPTNEKNGRMRQKETGWKRREEKEEIRKSNVAEIRTSWRQQY